MRYDARVPSLPDPLPELLRRLDEGLGAFYGRRYRGLRIFGSFARGDAREGSDVDVAVLLDGPVRSFEEFQRSEFIHWPLSLEYDLALSPHFLDWERFHRGQEPFLVNARREARDVP